VAKPTEWPAPRDQRLSITGESMTLPLPGRRDLRRAGVDERFLNRELSWLAFNERVLELATEPGIPLLERAKFCAIVSTNLDEFFMVRVSGIRQQVAAGVEVLSDVESELGEDPGLQKDGVEAHLQALLAASPDSIEDGLTLVRREYPTAIGPVDLLCRDGADQVVAIEVKRRGEIDGVEQLARYIERLNLDSSLGDVRGVYVAQSIKPQAKVLAESRGFTWVEVDYDELRGMQSDELKLF
jgi:hypothetical protein